jgi:capsular polysaccharide biosynthesis protein
MILSPAQTIPQRYVKSFLSRHGYDSIDLGVGETLSVVDLEFIPNMVGHGYAPHPALRQFFNNLLASAQLAEPGAVLDDRGERRIYISRRDSNNRILTNEQAVIDLVSSYGYCTFELSAMNFTEQMSLFHSATHIISPHGAGLANIVFCRPGTFVCELNMDTYLNGCIRRLAAISQVNYGCLIGLADENSRKLSWPHAMRWSLPIDPLIDTLKQLS